MLWFLRYIRYGLIAVLIALPQLICFTFTQTFQTAGTEGYGNTFLSFQFNWVNNPGGRGMRDFYMWFYIKNIGVPFLLLLGALFEKHRPWRRLEAAALPIVLLAEFVRFQPNEYDNNKLFYLAWLLLCPVAAGYARLLWHRLRGLRARPVLAVFSAVIIFLSAGLSIWRECVSDYQSFSSASVDAAQFVRSETPKDAVFLTGTQHLNPVDSIAGRSIVCGPDLYLYFHGFNTSQRRIDIERFYSNPAENLDVLEHYNVSYIYVSSYERSDYAIDDSTFDALFDHIFSNREADIWRVRRS